MITDVKINEALKKLYYERGYWGDKTIADVWDEQCEKYGDRTYVQDDLGTKLTYKQVDTGARKLASWLKEVGVQNGDVVSFQVPKWQISALFTWPALRWVPLCTRLQRI